MIRVHKIALDPTKAQADYFARACGTARFAWNWALGEWRAQYRAGGRPTEAGLRKQLNAIKRQEFPWMLEVSKTAPQAAIKNLGNAFQRFFKKLGGYPKFKRKGEHDSYQADNGPGTFTCEGKRIKLPVIGCMRMREAVRFEGELKSVTISRTADRWYAAIAVGTEDPVTEPRPESIGGVDLGVKALATVSDGTTVEGPKAHRFYLRKLRRMNRSMARKTEAAKKAMGLHGKAIPKGVRIPASANRKKDAAKLARLHARIANIRQDSLHKLTTDLVRRFTVIGIEDLNVRGMEAPCLRARASRRAHRARYMEANGRLARSISDMGFHEFRRQLEYKSALHGVRLVVAPRFHPSSKTCSAPGCGYVLKNLDLKTREWDCPACGAHHDRDLNAAKNLAAYAAACPPTASSAGSHACGETSSGHRPKAAAKLGSMKQEPSHGRFVHG